MRHLAGAVMVALIAAAAAGPSIAAGDQTSKSKDMVVADSAADQFKEGAQRVGEGAQHIGEGIKQGAIKVWEAAKAGAAAVSAKFSNDRQSGNKAGSASASGDADRH